MKRLIPDLWRTVFILACICLSSLPARAGGLETGGERVLPGMEIRVSAPIKTETLKIENPALNGGVSILQGPQIGDVNVLPLDTPAALMLSPEIQAALQQQPEARNAETHEPTAFATAQGLEAGKIETSAPQAYDGLKAADGGSDVPGGTGGGNGGGGANNGGNGGKNDDGGKLGKLYPRVVVILDTLKEPASDKLVHSIETLADNGVHVVFVTARAEKGENSAESILISKLKVRTGNPVVVVSYNGARIAAHNSKAENPKPLVEDETGFPEKTIAGLRGITAQVQHQLGVAGSLKEFGVPSAENPYVYGAELPKGVDAAAFARAYNAKLKSVGYRYKIEVVEQEDGRRYFFTQSTALKLNTGRIFKALYAQYPELRDDLKKEQILVLADSTKANNFLKALQSEELVKGQSLYIHGVKSAGDTEEAIGAVLGKNAFDKVVVQRNQLRGYVEWLENRAKFGDSPRGGSSGGYRMPAGHARYYRDLGFYRGIIMYDLMGRIYHQIRKGQYHLSTLEASLDLLGQMWYQPRKLGVRISPEMDGARYSPRWKALQKGYLETSKVWLRNYYHRNFKDFPHNVSEDVVGKMINLARDSKNSINIEYQSPYTGRRYVVYVRPARTELDRDDKGNILVAHVYRTGKEPYETEFEDNVEVNLVARAMLQGYGEKRADGKWYVNDEADPRVKVVFHYNTRDLSRIQTPQEIEARSPEITATVEKMQTDKEFLEYWEEQEAKNNKVASGRETAKAKAAAKAEKKPAKKDKKA